MNMPQQTLITHLYLEINEWLLNFLFDKEKVLWVQIIHILQMRKLKNGD